MGRFTSVQTYTDADAKLSVVKYEATATSSSAAALDGSNNREDEHPSDALLSDKRNVGRGIKGEGYHVDKVDNVMGSSAGAGSSDFHLYRATRRRELDRIESIETKHREEMKQKEFHDKLMKNKREFEERTKKRAEKRKKNKFRKLIAQSRGEDGEEKVDTTEEESKPLETPGGVPEIPNDGSFLEKMLQLQQQKKAAK